MSNLKHLSEEELRKEIRSIDNYRNQLETEWVELEKQANNLYEQAKILRSKHHNMGQKEAWARIYLARMT